MPHQTATNKKAGLYTGGKTTLLPIYMPAPGTAHALTSGNDIRTKEGLDDFLDQFNRLIGLDRLVVMHLNDSKADINSRIDRHENIGDGFIGFDGFRNIINHPKLAHVSGVMEVPGLEGNGPDAANLERLHGLLTSSP